MRLTTTLFAIAAAISTLLPLTLGVAVALKKPLYGFRQGGQVAGLEAKAPSYCEPPRSGPGQNLPYDFKYVDYSDYTLPLGLGNCCVTFIKAEKKRKDLSNKNLQDLENLVRLEAQLRDPIHRLDELGIWQLQRSEHRGNGPAVSEKVLKAYNSAIWSFEKGKRVHKMSGYIDTAIFQRGNETVGEQKITVKRFKQK